MTLPGSRIEEIVSLAEGYADTYFPDSWIDPARLLARLGITVSYNDYGNAFDGLLEWNRHKFHVYCNLSRVQSRTTGRARFTLGHELGHLLIDEHRAALISGKTPSQHPSVSEMAEPQFRVEAEANLFSSNLLMPAARLEKVLPANGCARTFQQIEQIRDTFNVSFLSAAWKLIESSDYAFCACIMWRKDMKPWYRLSRGFQVGGYLRLKRDPQHVSVGSPTHFHLNDLSSFSEFAPHTGITDAASWFFDVFSDSRKNIFLDETAVRLGSWGVFTFLTWHVPDPRH